MMDRTFSLLAQGGLLQGLPSLLNGPGGTRAEALSFLSFVPSAMLETQ